MIQSGISPAIRHEPTAPSGDFAARMRRALELDPLNEFNRSFYGWHLNYVRRYDEAIPIFRSLLATGPNKASNYLGLWGAYYRKGLYSEALTAAKGYFLTVGDSAFAEALGSGEGEEAYRAGDPHCTYVCARG